MSSTTQITQDHINTALDNLLLMRKNEFVKNLSDKHDVEQLYDILNTIQDKTTTIKHVEYKDENDLKQKLSKAIYKGIHRHPNRLYNIASRVASLMSASVAINVYFANARAGNYTPRKHTNRGISSFLLFGLAANHSEKRDCKRIKNRRSRFRKNTYN